MGEDECETKSSLQLREWIKAHTDVLNNIWADDKYRDTSEVSETSVSSDPLTGREKEYLKKSRRYARCC